MLLQKRRTYTYLIGVKVDTSILTSGLGNKRNALVQLAKRVVAAAAICKDFDAVESPRSLVSRTGTEHNLSPRFSHTFQYGGCWV